MPWVRSPGLSSRTRGPSSSRTSREAWHSRDAVLFVQFYKGAAVRVEAVPEEGRLRISWRVLGVVDVSTIDALQNSLLGIVEVLDQERPPARASLRPTLRIVEGGR